MLRVRLRLGSSLCEMPAFHIRRLVFIALSAYPRRLCSLMSVSMDVPHGMVRCIEPPYEKLWWSRRVAEVLVLRLKLYLNDPFAFASSFHLDSHSRLYVSLSLCERFPLRVRRFRVAFSLLR